MTAFRRTADGRTLAFEPAEGGALPPDRERGAPCGESTESPRRARLKALNFAPLNFHVGAWYSWVAYFPETTLYGR
jgi:hypothetical protein